MQDVELGILKEIDRICKENNIKFFSSGGTFLGSVRHKGFIPWDNDVDIGMYRDEYEKFIEIAPKKINEPYEVHTYRNCESHHYYMAHVVDTRYAVRRIGSIDQRVENIWVDVFPYDGFPNNPFVRNLHYIRLDFCRFMFHLAWFETVNITRKDRKLLQKVMINALRKTYKSFRPSKTKWRERIDLLLKKNDFKDCNYIANYIGIKGRKEIFPKYIFEDLKEYAFEDMKLLAPVDAEYVLSQLYGDYMSIPSKAERQCHPVEIIN